MMDADQIAAVMRHAAGDPSSGPVAEWIPSLAAAVAEALDPTPAPTPQPQADLEA